MSQVNLADLFCGGGGFSTGIAAACKELDKRPNLVAINHWDIAVETHKRNHPWARHLCTGLECVNPTDVAPSRLDLLAASPECTHFANARGNRPMSDQSRSSAWLILKWLQEIYVESVLIENVSEFLNWGALGADGRPLKSMRGKLFEQFVASLKALGYNVEWRILCAANYGGATTRERLFIMARRGRNKRIIWPDATHYKPTKDQREIFEMQRWRAAREVIDWSIPSESIFRRKRPLAPTTLARIEAGLKRFGGAMAEPFLVVLRRHMDGRSLDEPIPTITAGGNQIGLCQPIPFMLGQQSGGAPRGVNDPVPTIAGGGAISLTHPFFVEYHGSHPGRSDGDQRVRSVDEPLPTQTTENRFGLLDPFLVPFFGERGGQQPRAHSLDDPMPTVTSHGAGGLVQPFLITAGGPRGQGRHPKDIDQPMPTVLTDDRHALVRPFLTTVTHGKGDTRTHDVDKPLPTLTTKNGLGIAQPVMIGFYGSQNNYPVSEPLPTVSCKDRFGLITCHDEHGREYGLDIHFRMLHWRELANAMSFPEWYEFAGNRSEIVKQIGNSVEVRTATALARAALAS